MVLGALPHLHDERLDVAEAGAHDLVDVDDRLDARCHGERTRSFSREGVAVTDLADVEAVDVLVVDVQLVLPLQDVLDQGLRGAARVVESTSHLSDRLVAELDLEALFCREQPRLVLVRDVLRVQIFEEDERLLERNVI